MDYVNFIDTASFKAITEELSRLAQAEDPTSIDALTTFLTHKSDDTFGKHFIPRQACRALIQKGPNGIKALRSLIFEVDGFIYPSTIINSIWAASQGNLDLIKMYDMESNPVLNSPLNSDTISAAKKTFHDIIITSISDPVLFSTLINAFYQQTMLNPDSSNLITSIVKAITDSSIRITNQKLEDFSDLIEAQVREEDYQIFLKKNPVFLNPIASKTIDKHKLGDDLITDFVVETLESEYIVVEIEKPQDRIFTSSGDFSAAFTHAYGQVLDFISWIDCNIAYAQKKLPNIASPRGMLIIGRSVGLTATQKNKLNYFNLNSQRIQVYTYDDILLNARRLYQNIVGS